MLQWIHISEYSVIMTNHAEEYDLLAWKCLQYDGKRNNNRTHRSVLFSSSFSFMVVVVVVIAGIVFVWVLVSSLKGFHRNWSVFRIRNISYLLTWLKILSSLHKFIWIKGYIQLGVSTRWKQKWEHELLHRDLHSARLPHMLNTLPLTHTWTNPNGKKRSVCPWEPEWKVWRQSSMSAGNTHEYRSLL